MKLSLENFRETENKMIDNIDFKSYVIELAYKLLPFIKADMAVGDMEKVLEKFAPIGFMKIAEIAMQGKNERNQLAAAMAMVDRAGYRPVERSVHLEGDINKLAPAQLDSVLKNAWNRLPQEDKNKLVNLIKAPDGTYHVPDKTEVPNVTQDEIPTEDI